MTEPAGWRRSIITDHHGTSALMGMFCAAWVLVFALALRDRPFPLYVFVARVLLVWCCLWHAKIQLCQYCERKVRLNDHKDTR